MKPLDIVLGLIGICVLIVWCFVYSAVCFIFTGEAFPND